MPSPIDLEAKVEAATHPVIETNDWDTVFATRFSVVNKGISAAWSGMNSSLKSFSHKSSEMPSFNLSGSFDPWQLSEGGDGKNIMIDCPVAKGTYNYGSGKSYDLKGTTITIEIDLEWVPDPEQESFMISDATTITSLTTNLDAKKPDPNLVKQFANNHITLAAAYTIQVKDKSKTWIIQSGKSSYYLFLSSDKSGNIYLFIYEYKAQWKNNLVTISERVGTGNPAVIISQISPPAKLGDIGDAMLESMLSEWFESFIPHFNYIFNVLNLSTQLDKSDQYAWIKPTDTSYAVTDKGSLDTSLFGVLTMVNNNSATGAHQVHPDAIPPNCDAGFLISGTQFVKNILLPGACHIFDKASPSDFDIQNDGLEIINKNDLVWGRFRVSDTVVIKLKGDFRAKLNKGKIPADLFMSQNADDGILTDSATVQGKDQWTITDTDIAGDKCIFLLEQKSGSLKVYDGVEIHVKPQMFRMTVKHSQVYIKFNVTYPQSWAYDVTMLYTETVTFGLQNVGGKQIFNMNHIEKNGRHLNVIVDQTKAALTLEIITDVAVAVLGVVLAFAGPAFEAFAGGAAAGASAEEATTVIEVTEEEFSAFVGDNLEDFEAAEEESASDAEDVANSSAAESGGRWSRFKGAFAQPKYRAMAAIGGVIGATTSPSIKLMDIWLKAQIKGRWEQVPAFDLFSNQLIAPYSWPEIEAFEPESAFLADSLVIGLKTKSSVAAKLELEEE